MSIDSKGKRKKVDKVPGNSSMRWIINKVREVEKDTGIYVTRSFGMEILNTESPLIYKVKILSDRRSESEGLLKSQNW